MSNYYGSRDGREGIFGDVAAPKAEIKEGGINRHSSTSESSDVPVKKNTDKEFIPPVGFNISEKELLNESGQHRFGERGNSVDISNLSKQNDDSRKETTPKLIHENEFEPEAKVFAKENPGEIKEEVTTDKKSEEIPETLSEESISSKATPEPSAPAKYSSEIAAETANKVEKEIEKSEDPVKENSHEPTLKEILDGNLGHSNSDRKYPEQLNATPKPNDPHGVVKEIAKEFENKIGEKHGQEIVGTKKGVTREMIADVLKHEEEERQEELKKVRSKLGIGKVEKPTETSKIKTEKKENTPSETTEAVPVEVKEIPETKIEAEKIPIKKVEVITVETGKDSVSKKEVPKVKLEEKKEENPTPEKKKVEAPEKKEKSPEQIYAEIMKLIKKELEAFLADISKILKKEYNKDFLVKITEIQSGLNSYKFLVELGIEKDGVEQYISKALINLTNPKKRDENSIEISEAKELVRNKENPSIQRSIIFANEDEALRNLEFFEKGKGESEEERMRYDKIREAVDNIYGNFIDDFRELERIANQNANGNADNFLEEDYKRIFNGILGKMSVEWSKDANRKEIKDNGGMLKFAARDYLENKDDQELGEFYRNAKLILGEKEMSSEEKDSLAKWATRTFAKLIEARLLTRKKIE
jgi:hypothetical protein